jgi:hypothetical protein
MILFIDGHDTHFEVKTLETAMAAGVYLFRFPSHTTHVLQPLDVAIFGTFKQRMGDAVVRFHNSFEFYVRCTEGQKKDRTF